ncbi:MAG: glycosyltransferase family 2 protein [Chloroflexia bacterium]
MLHKPNNIRFIGLGAITSLFAAATVAGFKAMEAPDSVPPVDAIETESPGGGEWPFVSIIVPARNEERNLPRLLPSLLSQKYPAYEVIVVDDKSEDETPDILGEWVARDERLKIVNGVELPREEGWLGKPHAMHQGAQQAKGDWLLFTDADTVHSPLSISSSVAHALSHDADLFTIFPFYELGTPSERMIMPVAFQGIMNLYPAYKVNDPRSPAAIANGQYLLIRRSVYDAVGGIESVKGRIVEDQEFAKVVKSAGHRLLIADGQHLMNVRMYTNFQEVWEGWSKNVVISLQSNPSQAALAVVGVLSLTIAPIGMVSWARRSWAMANKSKSASDRAAAIWTTTLTAWQIGLPLIMRRDLDRKLGLPPIWTLTQPIGTAIMGAIMLWSLLRLLTGKGVTWKGRTYAANDV